MTSVASLSREHCRGCEEVTLHAECICIHCGTRAKHDPVRVAEPEITRLVARKRERKAMAGRR